MSRQRYESPRKFSKFETFRGDEFTRTRWSPPWLTLACREPKGDCGAGGGRSSRRRERASRHRCVEMDSNFVENRIRPVKLTAKNALFAGNDQGAQAWARIASCRAERPLGRCEK